MHVLAVGNFNEDKQIFDDMLGSQKTISFSTDPNKAIEELVDGHYKATVIAVNGAAGQWRGRSMADHVRRHPRQSQAV